MFSNVYKLMHKMQRNKHRPKLATHVHTHGKEVSTQHQSRLDLYYTSLVTVIH